MHGPSLSVDQKDAWNGFYLRNRWGWGGFADISWITRRLESGAKILELGTGNGKTFIPLCKKGYSCTGVDFSEVAVNQLRAGLSRISPNRCRVMVADVLKLPEDMREFDAVVMIHLLNHLSLKETEKLLLQCTSLLGKGGLVFAEMFGPEDMRVSGKETERGGIKYRYHTPEEITALDIKGLRTPEVTIILRERRYGGKSGVRELLRFVWERE